MFLTGIDDSWGEKSIYCEGNVEDPKDMSFCVKKALLRFPTIASSNMLTANNIRDCYNKMPTIIFIKNHDYKHGS